jgi:predicted CopG family antitoxin
MVKTITIADDVYMELLRIKGNKSFSEVLRELLKTKKGNSDTLLKMFGVLSEDEYNEAKKKIEAIKGEFEKWQSLIRT